MGSNTYGDHVTGDVANTSSPAFGRVVQNVVNSNAAVLFGQGVEVFFEKNILERHVGKNEVDLGPVSIGTAANNSTDNLEHGGDASAAGNHAKVADHIGGVDKSALGAAYADGLTDDERSHVLGDVALRIGLDQKIKVAGLVVAGDGCI